jgi:hypothetical protein
MQMEGKISVLCQNFIAIDNTKSSEPMKKKVKLLTPGKIREQTVDSKSDGTGSDTMIVDENGHEEAGIEPLLQEKWASSQSYSGAQVEHSASLLSASEDDDNDEDLDDEDDDDDSEYNRPH